MNSNNTLLILLGLLLIGMSSCSVPKDITYLQGIDHYVMQHPDSANHYTTRIAPDDQLAIHVSAMNPKTVQAFNPQTFSPKNATLVSTEETANNETSPYNYIVYSDGTINFPIIGRIKVEGLTRQELSDLLVDRLKEYEDSPIVNVSISNFKISIQGDVMKPNIYYIKSDRVTILEALAMAGDLNISADRRNILLIRDDGGRISHHRFDLTDPATLESPYFYLKQNDYIYVEPNDVKKRNSRYDSLSQQSWSIFSAIITAASVIVSIMISTGAFKRR